MKRQCMAIAAFAAALCANAEEMWREMPLSACHRVPGLAASVKGLCLEGQMLYAIGGGTLYALDVSNPTRPTVVGSLGGMDNNRQVVAQNSFVYVVSRETGLRIIDARDPRNMKLRSRYDSVEFATGIDVVGATAFLSERINGVEVVDVADPDRPMHVCIRKTNESQSNRYRDGYLYSGEWGAGGVTVFDAHDLKNFRKIKMLELGGFGDGVELDGDYLYCSTGHDAKNRHAREVSDPIGAGRGLDIFSLANPAAPKWISRVNFPVFTPRQDDYWTPRVARGYAFCCDSHNGFFVVDVRDPVHPKPVSRFCVPQEGQSWPSGAISSCAVGVGCVYVSCSPGGLWVVPFPGLEPPARPKGSPPTNAGYRETYATDVDKFFVYRPAAAGQARTVVIHRDVAYVAFGDAGLHVLRVSKQGFTKLGELPGGHRVTDCCFVGDKLVTAEGLDGFAVYELPSPAEFREVDRRDSVGGSSVAFWCWPLEGDSVILSSRARYDVHTLANFRAKTPRLKFAGACLWDKYPADGALGGRFPVLCPSAGLMWLDVTGGRPRLVCNPKKGDQPVAGTQQCGVCRFGADRYLYTVCVKGKLAFVFVDKEGRLSEPIAVDAALGIPRAVGNLVVVTNRSGRKVSVWDFSDPSKPKLLRKYSLAGNPDIGTFFQGKAVIPAGHQGLVMEK